MAKEQGNILGNLLGGMENLGKLGESEENPELDKMGSALEKLKKEVDIQKLKQAVEQGNEVEIVTVLNPLEKLFKEVECPEAGFTDPDEINAKWLVMKEHIVNWLIEEREKENRKPIDDFLNEVSTLTNFPTKKEEAEGLAKKLKENLEPKKLLFGGLVAWLTKEADSMRDADGSDSIFGSIMRWFAETLGGKDKEKIDTLSKETLAAVKAKDWDLVEEKANALLKEDKDNKSAKEALALAEKKKAALAAAGEGTENTDAAPEAEKYEKEMAELKSGLEYAGIPIAFELADYEKALKDSHINGDPNALAAVVKDGSKATGKIGALNKEIQNHASLRDGKFEFKLNDYLVTTRDIEDVIRALDEENKNSMYKLEDATPSKLRDFLTAVKTGEGLAKYKRPEEEPTKVASIKPDEQPARTPPGANL